MNIKEITAKTKETVKRVFDKRAKIVVAVVGVLIIALGVTTAIMLNKAEDSSTSHQKQTLKEQTDKNKAKITSTASADYTKKTSDKDYEDIYEKLTNARSIYDERVNSYSDSRQLGTSVGINIPESEVSTYTAGDSVTTNVKSDSSDDTTDYSTTNVQVLGVDEADIVKNDGKYLYALNSSTGIDIVKASGIELEKVSTIDTIASEFYIVGDRIVLIETDNKVTCDNTDQDNNDGSSGVVDEDTSISSSESISEDAIYINNKCQVDTLYYYEGISTVKIYDISDRSNPKLVNSLKQDGEYITSRVSDGYLYTISCDRIKSIDTKDKCDYYIPSVGGSRIGADCISIPEDTYCDSYMVMTSLNIEECYSFKNSKAILNDCQQYYVSNYSIYSINNNYYSKDSTISKFRYDKGVIYDSISQELDGYINNSFSVDEYKDNLRVVTTCRDHNNDTTGVRMKISNKLTIYDADLKKVGQINNIAEGETIRSARFLGDTGYFVTYRNMDPLFAVDLTDATNPKILSELKITGFSSYLHPYDENKLLGIGYEIDPDTQETQGIKLSMFDISNPSDVKELSKKIIPVKDEYANNYDIAAKSNTYINKNTDCSAIYDHRAVMIDTDKNIFGFGLQDTEYIETYSVNGSYSAMSNSTELRYVMYSYDDNDGFIEKINYKDGEVNRLQDSDGYQASEYRGTYIGNYLYLVNVDGMYRVLDLNTGEELGEYGPL